MHSFDVYKQSNFIMLSFEVSIYSLFKTGISIQLNSVPWNHQTQLIRSEIYTFNINITRKPKPLSPQIFSDTFQPQIEIKTPILWGPLFLQSIRLIQKKKEEEHAQNPSKLLPNLQRNVYRTKNYPAVSVMIQIRQNKTEI